LKLADGQEHDAFGNNDRIHDSLPDEAMRRSFIDSEVVGRLEGP